AYRAHLDADHVSLLEERAPRILPAWRASQFLHPAFHHLADGFRLVCAGSDAAWVLHCNHASRVGPGHSELGEFGFAPWRGQSGGCREQTPSHPLPASSFHTVISVPGSLRFCHISSASDAPSGAAD